MASAIINGYFLVSSKNKCVKIFPTCVEIYYHEEAQGGIKDPIVYHRNTNKKIKDIFGLGILHNHVSGIDITFEREEKEGNNKTAIRASALIREFKIEENGVIDICSTHLYDALFSTFNIFDGFSVEWHDESIIKNKISEGEYRKNVPMYKTATEEKILAKEYNINPKTKDGKYIQCKRKWQFRIK